MEAFECVAVQLRKRGPFIQPSHQEIEDTMVKGLVLAAVAAFVTGTASAEVPLFAAKCPTGLTVDSSRDGKVYINGKSANVIKRPDGQISANSAGVWVDITPQGGNMPIVTYTAKDKSTGRCEVISFAAPGGGAHGSTAPALGDSSERAGRGDFDADGAVKCAEGAGADWAQCNAAVAREGGGTATVVVTRPDGRKRFIFFEKGKAIGADLSQADGSQHFHATRKNDRYLIEAGHERYEIIEAMVFGD
jgi:hypothetical protein